MEMKACPHTHAPPSVMGGKADTQKIPHRRAEWNLLSLFSFFLPTPQGINTKLGWGLVSCRIQGLISQELRKAEGQKLKPRICVALRVLWMIPKCSHVCRLQSW